MKRWLAVISLGVCTLSAAGWTTWRRDRNLIVVWGGEGAAELEFITTTTFRYTRRTAPAPARPQFRDRVEFTVTEEGDRLKLQTRYITVSLFKKGMNLQVHDGEGKLVASFGAQGFEPDLQFRRHGFLLSRQGYGLSRNARGECFFHYGPSPKEILEQRYEILDKFEQLTHSDLRVLEVSALPRAAVRLRTQPALSWSALADLVSEAVASSLEGVVFPALNITGWQTAPEPLRRRALDLASVFPLVYSTEAAKPELPDRRKKLASFLVTYFWEARDRGLPLIRPVGMQYPHDPLAAEENSVFLLGDELLIVPVVSEAPKRSFYLPQGIWTDLESNAVLKGKRRVEIDVPEYLPVYLRNGSILPVDGDPMALHYTPTLAAELFLYEPELDTYSQFHASPAGDFLRLQAEPKKSRRFEWIVHHVDRPKAIRGFQEAQSRADLRPGRWHYDAARRNLHLVIHAAADSDVVVNIE